MSKKKKKIQPPVSTTSAPQTSAPLPTPDQFARQMTFDAMEDRIRGEEMLQHEANKNLKEEQDIKKKLKDAEVDRRLEELRKQIGLKK